MELISQQSPATVSAYQAIASGDLSQFGHTAYEFSSSNLFLLY